MNLYKKVIGIIVSGLLALINITSFAQTEQEPQTVFSVEPKRTEIGISYDIYIEKPNLLSTLCFEMNFDCDKIGEVKLEDNECFDILHTEWKSGSEVSVKGYLGRTGNKTGFSSSEKIKIAQITIPLDVSLTGELNANISKAICAGITETDGNAVKGNVEVTKTNIKYFARECSILDFSKDTVEIFSTENRNVDVIFAAYNQNGNLIDAHKENVTINQGKNKISVSGIDVDKSQSVSVVIWDDITSMRPLADKATINK